MKYIKKFESELHFGYKYRVGQFVKFKIPLYDIENNYYKVLSSTFLDFKFFCKVENLVTGNTLSLIPEKSLIPLTKEEREELELKIATNKYNL